jgi:hypothetical protein
MDCEPGSVDIFDQRVGNLSDKMMMVASRVIHLIELALEIP